MWNYGSLEHSEFEAKEHQWFFMCRQEYSLPLQAQDSQEAGRRLAHKHKRRIFRQKTLTASRRQVTGEQALPRLDSSEVAAQLQSSHRETFCAKMHMMHMCIRKTHTDTQLHRVLLLGGTQKRTPREWVAEKKSCSCSGHFIMISNVFKCVAPAWMWTMERNVWLPQATAGYNSFPPAQLSSTI